MNSYPIFISIGATLFNSDDKAIEYKLKFYFTIETYKLIQTYWLQKNW